MGITLSIVSIVLFITETVLQLYVAINVLGSNSVIFYTMMVMIALPFVITNIVSAILVLRTMNFAGKNCGKFVCMILHFCLLGLMWRFFKLLLLYEERDWYEFINLRVLHISLQSLPFITFTGFTVFFYMDSNIDAVTIATILVTLLSSAIVMVKFNIGKHLFESEEFLEKTAKLKKHLGIIFLIVGTALLVVSRCSSIVLFSSVQTYWVFVPLGFHFLAYLLAITTYKYAKSDLSCESFLRMFLLAFTNTFDLLDTSFKKIQCSYVLYYSAILVENLAMAAVWIIFDGSGHVLKLMAFVIIVMGFLVGMILKFGSCAFIFPESADALADSSTCSEGPLKQIDISRSVDTADMNQSYPTTDHMLETEGITFPQYRESELYDLNRSRTPNGKLELRYQNPVFEMDEEDIRYREQQNSTKEMSDEFSNRSRSDKYLSNTIIEVHSPHRMDVPMFQYSVDMASSNSRNTNTISNRIPSYNVPRETNYTKKVNNFSENCTFPRSRNPTHASNIKNTYLRDKKHLQKELRVTRSNHVTTAMQQQHVNLSFEPSMNNCVESYSDTVSVTDYFSDDEYFDTTDWTTSDSEGATTWPPSNQHSSNLNSLPKGKVSKHENIQMWLKSLPFNDAISNGEELQSELGGKNKKNVPHHDKKWYRQMKPKHVFTKLCGLGLDPLPKLFAAEMESQVSESSLPFRKPHVRRWQPKDTMVVSKDCVLESVV